MTSRTHVLIDLDGTITDSEPGIIASLRRALAPGGHRGAGRRRSAVGHRAAVRARVAAHRRARRSAVGRDRALPRALRGRRAVRERRSTTVSSRCSTTLRADGLVLALATAKPEITARRIVEHFGLADRFAVLAGATFEPGPPDEGRGDRPRPRASSASRAAPHVVMVGDRDHDVHGAQVHGIDTIGVLWGYGSEAELLLAGRRGPGRHAGRRRRAASPAGCPTWRSRSPRPSVTVRMTSPTSTSPIAAGAPAVRSGTADRFMRRLLRLPADAPPGIGRGRPQGVPDLAARGHASAAC